MWQEPFARLESAITRVAPAGGTEPVAPHEAIDLPTAIKAMTLDSAYLMNSEESVGSIEVGKRADMIVLDQNLFDIPEPSIDSSKVLTTIFDGKVVYDASSSPTGVVAIEERYGAHLDFSGEHGHPGCEWRGQASLGQE